MNEISIIVRTADQTRKAELKLDSQSTGLQIIQAAVENWALPCDASYNLVNASHGKTLVPNLSLKDSNVKEGDVLEVQPVLVAGKS